MPRPASDDPTVALTVRLPRSVLDRWTERADAKGVGVREMIRSKLVEAVAETPKVERKRPEPVDDEEMFDGPHAHRFVYLPSIGKRRCACGEVQK